MKQLWNDYMINTVVIYSKENCGYCKMAKQLMEKKNHDYGEAWRDMRISSLTDLILMKVLRVKQIENNDGQTVASEGVEANYMDMANYALFALILSSGETSN